MGSTPSKYLTYVLQGKKPRGRPHSYPFASKYSEFDILLPQPRFVDGAFADSVMRSTQHTRKGSFTGTSSPPTSSSPSVGTQRSWTLDWPSSLLPAVLRAKLCRRPARWTRISDQPGHNAGYRGLYVTGAGAGEGAWMHVPISSRSGQCCTRW